MRISTLILTAIGDAALKVLQAVSERLSRMYPDDDLVHLWGYEGPPESTPDARGREWWGVTPDGRDTRLVELEMIVLTGIDMQGLDENGDYQSSPMVRMQLISSDFSVDGVMSPECAGQMLTTFDHILHVIEEGDGDEGEEEYHPE